MSNLIIENATDSTLDLSSINDVNGNPVSLWPRGDKRSSREITEAASLHASVQSVVNAKWATLTDIATAIVPSSPAPAPDPVGASPEPAPTDEVSQGLSPAPASEPTGEPPTEETTTPIEVTIDATPEQAARGLEQIVERTREPPAETRGSRRGRGA